MMSNRNLLSRSEIMVNDGVLNVQHSFSDVDAETIEQLSWKRNISKPHPHDVLSGRGNSKMNKHPGNQYFRSLVQYFKNEYVIADKDDRPMFAKLIHCHVRALNPPGRFLRRDMNKGEEYWTEICEKSASEKTRQALREGAAKIKKEIEDGKRKVETHFRRSLSSAVNKAPQTLQSLVSQKSDSDRSMNTISTASCSTFNSTMNTSTSTMNTSTSTMNNMDNNLVYNQQPLLVEYHQPSPIISMIPEAVLDNLIKLEVKSNTLNGSLVLPTTPLLETLNEEPQGNTTITALDDNIVQRIVDQEQFNDRSAVEGTEEFPGGNIIADTFIKAINTDDDNHTTSCIPKNKNDNNNYNDEKLYEPTKRDLSNSLLSTNDTAYTEEFPGQNIEPKISFDTNAEMKVAERGWKNSSHDFGERLMFNDLYSGKPVRAKASFVGPRNHSLYHPDIHKYHRTSQERKASSISEDLMKEVQALTDMKGSLQSLEEGCDDHTSTSVKRKFTDSAEVVNHFCNSLRKSIAEFSQVAKRMDRRESRRASFLLRQSVFSACAEIEAHSHNFGNEESPGAQSHNIFNDTTTMDDESISKGKTWTGRSTKQLLETVFGEESHTMKEILANVLDSASTDELMKQLFDPEEGSDNDHSDNVVKEKEIAMRDSISNLSLE